MRRSISTIPSLCSAQEYVYMRKRPSRRDWPEKWKGKISQKWRTIRRERKLNTRPLRRQINKRLGLLTRQDNVFQGICLGERVQRDVSRDGSRPGSIKDIKVVYKDYINGDKNKTLLGILTISVLREIIADKLWRMFVGSSLNRVESARRESTRIEFHSITSLE